MFQKGHLILVADLEDGVLALAQALHPLHLLLLTFFLNPLNKNCPRWTNLVDIFVNLYFSDFKPYIWLFQGRAQ